MKLGNKMNILQANMHQIYEISKIKTDEKVTKRLQDLGIVPKSEVVLIQLSKESGVIVLKNSRLALATEILSQIEITEKKTRVQWIPLDEVKIGERVKVVSIHGEGAVKRRLMDMGVTKNVEILVRKVAPLGDPIEVVLRGYNLSLRKAEATLILVERQVRLLAECLHNFSGNLGNRFMICFNGNVCGCFVFFFSLLHKLPNALRTAFSIKNRAIIVRAYPIKNGIRLGGEEDYIAVLFHNRHIFFLHGSAASAGNYQIIFPLQLPEKIGFLGTKILFAFGSKNFRNGHLFPI